MMDESAFKKEMGRRIELRRKDLGLTLADVATEVGVAASTIQRYEKGIFTKIKMPVIEAIAAALHVNPAWLIGETSDPVDYEDGELLASIPLSYIELFDGDMKCAYEYMRAVEEEQAPFSAEEGERDFAKNDDEKEMLILARHMEPLSDEDRKILTDQIKSSIDIYLRAKGLSGTEDK